MAIITRGGCQAEIVELVFDRIRAIQLRLARDATPEFLSKRGPRYQSLKQGLVDLNRAFHTNEQAVRENRHEPDDLVSSMVSLAAVCIKLATDVAAANAENGSFEVVEFDNFE